LRQVQRSIPSPARAAKVSHPGPDRPGGSEPFWEGISLFFSRLEWRGIPAGYLPAIKRSVMAAMWLLVCAALAFAFWPKTVIDLPAKDPMEPLSNNGKVMCVTMWTIGVSVFVILWAMTPTVGDSETLSHVVFPYWMISYHWHGRGAGWMLLPIALQFPLYGWIIACAWKDNRLLGGMAIVTCAHVGAMLLAVFMAATSY
jgi:hypothetical protein